MVVFNKSQRYCNVTVIILKNIGYNLFRHVYNNTQVVRKHSKNDFTIDIVSMYGHKCLF